MPTTTPPTRRRRREIERSEAVAVPPNLITLAKSVADHNKEQNRHKRIHDADRKKLLAGMDDAGLLKFEHAGITAEITCPDAMGIDMKKLQTLVSAEVWWKIISTSKKAIEDHAGRDVANRVLTYVVGGGTRNVKVSS